MTHTNSDTDIRITILVDNVVTDGLLTEHGFSLWIEVDGKQILFDTGQGPALAANARQLDIDWSRADHLVLSHGHYDHTGGVHDILAQAAGIHVHCHPGVARPRYSIHSGTPRPVHMPIDSGKALEHLPVRRVDWVLQPTALGPRVGLSGPIPRITAYEDTGGPFYLDPEGRRPDSIEDDLALWIHSAKGLVVCLGCCHAGLINTLDHMLRLNPGERIHAVIGGLHLLNAGYDRLEHTVSALHSLSPDKIIACHCSGAKATALLRDALGARVSQGAAGQVYDFDIAKGS